MQPMPAIATHTNALGIGASSHRREPPGTDIANAPAIASMAVSAIAAISSIIMSSRPK